MHELSIALSILDIAAETSQRHGGGAVKSIYVRIGPLSGVVIEALQSAYEMAREESPFPDSCLICKAVPVSIFCPTCQTERAVESIHQMSCVECGTFSADIIHGREMEITAMEVEEPASPTHLASVSSEI